MPYQVKELNLLSDPKGACLVGAAFLHMNNFSSVLSTLLE